MKSLARFPTYDPGKTSEEKTDVAIIEAITPLTYMDGQPLELHLDGRTLEATSTEYQGNGRSRCLMTLRDKGIPGLAAYLDMRLDYQTRSACCADRNIKAPGDAAELRALNPYMEGFAIRSGDALAGDLLTGLTLYTLNQQRITTLAMQKYSPTENDGDEESVYEGLGAQSTGRASNIFHGVTPEIRTLVAKALSVD